MGGRESQSRPARGARQRDEQGFALMFLGLSLTLLMMMAAFAVDIGHWYYVGEHEQKAADTAALRWSSSPSPRPDNSSGTTQRAGSGRR